MKRISNEDLAEAIHLALLIEDLEPEVSEKLRKVIDKNFDVVDRRLRLKKIGRPGNKIYQAFEFISEKPVPINEVMKRFGIKWTVLRQHRRFDTHKERGKTHIKDGKIFREAATGEKIKPKK